MTLPPTALASKYPRVTNVPLPVGFRAPRMQRPSEGGGNGFALAAGATAVGLALWWASRR